MTWCGNDAVILSFYDKIVLVGPREYETINLKTKSGGIKCIQEIDGMRIITSENIYFLERVQESLIKTFTIASLHPSAKLHSAQKSVDFNIPKADEIIRELDK